MKKRTVKWNIAASRMDGFALGWQGSDIYLHIAKCNMNLEVKSAPLYASTAFPFEKGNTENLSIRMFLEVKIWKT